MIPNKHLFLKIPDGKPPFIGIGYEADCNHGSIDNMDILRYKDKQASLLIRKQPSSLDILVIMKGFYHTYGYSNVSFSHAEFNAWLRACKDATNINFGHVQKFNFGHVLCQTHGDRKPFFIPVSKIMVISDSWGPVIAFS
jgi:hypothetical protein